MNAPRTCAKTIEWSGETMAGEGGGGGGEGGGGREAYNIQKQLQQDHKLAKSSPDMGTADIPVFLLLQTEWERREEKSQLKSILNWIFIFKFWAQWIWNRLLRCSCLLCIVAFETHTFTYTLDDQFNLVGNVHPDSWQCGSCVKHCLSVQFSGTPNRSS